jgi:hypothetical protein
MQEMKTALLLGPAELVNVLKQQYMFASVFLEEIFLNAEGSIELTANISKVSVHIRLEI